MQKQIAGGDRNQALDALKGVAIVGVLFVHMGFQNRFPESVMHMISSAQLWLAWCVMAFFFAAGLLTPFESIDFMIFKAYVLKRAARLLLPCIVFSLSYKIILNIIFYTFSIGKPCYIDKGDFHSMISFVFAPVGPQFYFLPYLFFISVLTVGLMLFIKDPGLMLCGVSLLCLIFYINSSIPAFACGPDFLLLPAYLLNYVLGLACRKDTPCHWIHFLIFTFCIIVMCFTKNSFFYAYYSAPLAIYLLLTFIKCPNGATFLGRKAGAIYVWHDPLILPICSILVAKIFVSTGLQVIIIMIGGIVISIALGEMTKRVTFLKYYRF